MNEKKMNKKVIGFIIGIALGVVIAVGVIFYMNRYRLISDNVVVELGEEIDTDTSNYVQGTKNMINSTVLDFSKVEDKIGIYEASATFRGKVLSFNVEVKDTKPPVIITKTARPTVYAKDTTIRLLDYIDTITDSSPKNINVFDNEKQIVKDAVNQFENIEFTLDTVSTHEIVIVATDASNNSSNVTLEIEAKDAPPVISGVSEGDVFEMYVGDSPIDILSGINSSDSIDGACEVTSNFAEVVNTESAGDYTVIIKSTDKNNNESTVSVTVRVNDKPVYTTPVTNSSSDSNYNSNSTYNYNNGSDYNSGASNNSSSVNAGTGSSSGGSQSITDRVPLLPSEIPEDKKGDSHLNWD